MNFLSICKLFEVIIMTTDTGFFFANTYKNYSKKYIHDEAFISLIGSIGGIFGGLRFMWGPFTDLTSYKIVYGIILVLQIVLASTFPFAVRN